MGKTDKSSTNKKSKKKLKNKKLPPMVGKAGASAE